MKLHTLSMCTRTRISENLKLREARSIDSRAAAHSFGSQLYDLRAGTPDEILIATKDVYRDSNTLIYLALHAHSFDKGFATHFSLWTLLVRTGQFQHATYLSCRPDE